MNNVCWNALNMPLLCGICWTYHVLNVFMGTCWLCLYCVINAFGQIPMCGNALIKPYGSKCNLGVSVSWKYWPLTSEMHYFMHTMETQSKLTTMSLLLEGLRCDYFIYGRCVGQSLLFRWTCVGLWKITKGYNMVSRTSRLIGDLV